MRQSYPPNPHTDGPAADRAALARLAWLIGLALILALVGPPELFGATFSAMLGVGALAVSLTATILRESVWAPHLTRWDMAALLYLLGALFGWSVDSDAVRDFLQAQGYAG